jgi:Tfp pilus assembly PilM family ATPase
MRTVGLELGERELRAVVGEPRRGRWELLEAAVQPLPEAPEARLGAVAAFLEQHARGAQIAVGLRLADCSVRLVSFPAAGADDLERLARAEAESHFAAPAGSLDVGWAVVEPANSSAEPAGAAEALLAVAVCRHERVDEILAPLTAARLVPRLVGVTAVALANLFAAPVRAGGVATAVVNVADDEAELLILDAGGRLRHIRTVPAEIEDLAAEVGRSLLAHSGAGGEAVKRVLLCGSGINGHFDELQAAIGLSCELGDPWAVVGAALPIAEQSTAYSVATGLMLQGGDVPLPINLRGPKRAAAKAVAPRRLAAPLAAVLALVAMLAMAGGGLRYATHVRRLEVRQAHEAVIALEKQREQADGASPAVTALLRATRDGARADHLWLDVLRELAERLPPGVAIAELVRGSDHSVTLRGEANGAAAMSGLLGALHDTGRFDTVRLDHDDPLKVGAEQRHQFQVTCLPKAAETTRGGTTP